MPVKGVFGGNQLGVLGSYQALLAEFFPKMSLVFSPPSAAWERRFSQNDLHCDHLSAGVAPPTSETRSLEVFPSQLSFDNKLEAVGGLASCSPWCRKE